jgi:hypothetical protein
MDVKPAGSYRLDEIEKLAAVELENPVDTH